YAVTTQLLPLRPRSHRASAAETVRREGHGESNRRRYRSKSPEQGIEGIASRNTPASNPAWGAVSEQPGRTINRSKHDIVGCLVPSSSAAGVQNGSILTAKTRSTIHMIATTETMAEPPCNTNFR